MAEKDKRFYWLKLKSEFMNGEIVDFLMSQKNGANYVVLYQMLALKTMNTSGKLCSELGEMLIPFDPEKIQRECKWFDIDTIRVAIELYSKLGLIYKNKDSILEITNFEELVGSETYWAKQKRIQREQPSGQSLDNVQFPLISNISNSLNNNTLNNKVDNNVESNVDKKTSTKDNKLLSLIREFFTDEDVILEIGMWLKHKQEKGQTYKPTGLKSLLQRLKRELETNGKQFVIDEIRYSIGNNYSGIYPATEQKSKSETIAPSQYTEDDLKRYRRED